MSNHNFDVELTPQQKKWWTNSKSMMLWQAPGFAHIFTSMLNPRKDESMMFWTRDIPTMATDGEIMLANPEFFFELPIEQRVFAMAHEIQHNVMFHCLKLHEFKQAGFVVLQGGKKLPFDATIANYAQDYVINDLLVVSNVGKIKQGWLHDRSIGTWDMSWVDVYERLFKQCGGKPQNLPGQGNGTGQPSAGSGQFDQHMPPGQGRGDKSPGQAAQVAKERAQAWRNATAQALQLTKESARGQGSQNMIKMFEQLLEPKVLWTDHIQGEFARKVGNTGYDFRRADRRLITRGIYGPGRSGNGCNTVAVFMDSSGSIYGVDHLIDRFYSEMGGIFTELRPQRIIVIWCDSQVQRVDIIEDEMDLAESYHKGASGGGGTSFIPPFEWIKANDEEEKIDAAVYLTDLEGSFPREAPPYPVIWCSIKPLPVPFGTRVDIPSDGTA